MRVNLPITANEYELAPDAALVEQANAAAISLQKQAGGCKGGKPARGNAQEQEEQLRCPNAGYRRRGRAGMDIVLTTTGSTKC